MKVAVLGTGMVGRAHAGRLSELGHDVVVGTKDVEKTMSAIQPDGMGNQPFSFWHKSYTEVKLVNFAEAAQHGEIVLEALNGAGAVAVLKSVEKEIDGKVLISISNPLDFSKGMPPTLFVCNTDSLGEQIQKALPKVKVVKTLNTTNANIQVDPGQLADADHDVFLSGNDADSKLKVTEILKGYGWKNIIDLGDISTARGTEMMMPVWLNLWGALKTSKFNYRIVTENPQI